MLLTVFHIYGIPSFVLVTLRERSALAEVSRRREYDLEDTCLLLQRELSPNYPSF